MKDSDKNCKNCGAPLTAQGDCEYCGTKRQRRPHSGLEITSEFIRFYADDRCIGEEEVNYGQI